MELNTLANLAEIVGAVIVIGGLWFAVVQILQYRQQRRDMAAIELARSFQSPAFAHALRLVLSMPDGIRAEELRKRDTEYEEAAIQLALTLESVGIMAHRRIIDLDIVWELLGGVLLDSWDKLGTWVEDVRAEQRQEKFSEWMQWLAEQMKRHKVGSPPAYRLYQTWEP